MKLILTRHGETIENLEGILQGHLPGRLSEEGIYQAKMLALKLKYMEISAIYSSDLARAADTANEIAVFHPQAYREYTSDLREADLYSLTGQLKTKVKWTKENIEPEDSMRKRALYILGKAYATYPNSTVLVVGHSGINKVLIETISEGKIKVNGGLHNTGITLFEIDNKKTAMLIFDNISHLL